MTHSPVRNPAFWCGAPPPVDRPVEAPLPPDRLNQLMERAVDAPREPAMAAP
ncbi:hypothetical protein [Streptomyces katsurahamanus]|uniref:hypothetical protein n=1 Tax=Streptomyces katsurahamanus TaxID=2577098 RepID=UPI00129539E7|nr:hypothetical protein [Streptomyces katsurahamanus]